MKKIITIPVMVSAVAMIAACGGGGGATSTVAPATPTSKPDFNLTGTVPGTLIEAFCENGSYYAVNSETNSSSRHPFKLKLPKNLSCRLVMTTNENDPDNKVVTPIKFINSNGIGSIAFRGRDDIDLDYIALALSRAQMHSDNNGDGVEDVAKELILNGLSTSSLEILVTENDPLDIDNDDIINIYEDDDGDKISNHDDHDDDNDGIDDEEDDDRKHDRDGDGISNNKDIDDDNDGLDDESDDDDDNDGIKDEDEIDEEEVIPVNPTDPVTPADPVTPTDPVVTTPTAGRLLAAQCAQCHGTDGNSVTGIDSLDGESRNEIVNEMLEMQNDNDNELMHLQAKGYTAEQIGLIADYFSGLSANNQQGGN